MKKKKDLFAILPSIDEVLNDERIIELCGILPRSIVLDSIRSSVDKYRSQIIKLDEDKLDGFELSQEMIIID
ncbi:MAG: L-seryl-tRNA(Sec) selenium transferase, partial [Peptostreptococcus sp.]|nr:L-seryl-tRNA(Sec) selenium transferase [Peptostreptococcus sp.]